MESLPYQPRLYLYEQVDLNYLFTQLNDEKSWKISGAAQPFITLATVRDRLIQLPPLAEQQRIAALLEHLAAQFAQILGLESRLAH